MPHLHELIDFTVSAFIIHPDLDKVLLVHHKKYGGLWLQVGGHVELNEDTDQALRREIREESGLEVDILSSNDGPKSVNSKSLYVPNFMQIHDIADSGHRHIDLKYVALAKSVEVVLEDAHSEIRWFSRDDLDDPKFNVHPTVSWYARRALDLAR